MTFFPFLKVSLFFFNFNDSMTIIFLGVSI